MTTVDTTLSAIDQAIGGEPECVKCGRPLGGSVSDDFCSEDCQAAWRVDQAGPVPQAPPTTANEEVPETAPTQPLGWLGPAPQDAYVRAGHEILDTVSAFVSRFSVFPDQHCAPTLALWYAHTHIVDRFYVTPRIVLDSAEPGSGKTRVLEVAQFLVAAAEMTFSATAAALFRLVSEEGLITILFDEVDAIFTKTGGANEDLRALLNAGYKRGATIPRCVGDAKNMKVKRFKVFAPAILAGIAQGMPATITTRAITIHMRKRRHDEEVDEFWEEDVEREASPIRQALADWAGGVVDEAATARPVMPAGVRDRSAEIWRPLVALADAAGGHWPDTVRAACRHFVLDSGPQTTSDGVRLLADLRDVFAEHDTDRMATADILVKLVDLDESPWGELDRPLTARRLAHKLSRYGVRPVAFDCSEGKVKGYVTFETSGKQGQSGLADAWSRYLPADIGNCGNHGNRAGQTVTDTNVVTDESVTTATATEPRGTATGPPGYRFIGNQESIGNHLTREVTAVTAVTDPGGEASARRGARADERGAQ